MNPLVCSYGARPTLNRLRPIPSVARCACGEIVISREIAQGELRWCAECRSFVEQIVRVCSGGLTAPTLPPEGADFFAHVAHVEIQLIEQALEQGGSIYAAAKLLRLNRTTLSEKIRRYAARSERLADARGTWCGPAPRHKKTTRGLPPR